MGHDDDAAVVALHEPADGPADQRNRPVRLKIRPRGRAPVRVLPLDQRERRRFFAGWVWRSAQPDTDFAALDARGFRRIQAALLATGRGVVCVDGRLDMMTSIHEVSIARPSDGGTSVSPPDLEDAGRRRAAFGRIFLLLDHRQAIDRTPDQRDSRPVRKYKLADDFASDFVCVRGTAGVTMLPSWAVATTRIGVLSSVWKWEGRQS